MSDSDKTIDSDELHEILQRRGKPLERKTKAKNIVRTVHAISESDSDSEDCNPKNASISKKRKTSPLIKKHEASSSTNVRELSGSSKGTGTLLRNDSPCRKKLKTSLVSEQKKGAEQNTEIVDLHSYFGCYFTKVSGIPSIFNQKIALNVADLLSPTMGKLIKSIQFNYMIDVHWLIEQYPQKFRSLPILLVYGLKRGEKDPLVQAASQYPNVTLCQAKLDIAYGTHHTKMMMMLYEEGMRVVIHTANLIEGDWHQKTQGIWVSPLFPHLKHKQSSTDGDSPTNFRADLIQYLTSYSKSELSAWCNHIKEHDFSLANVYLIASVPGRHVAPHKSSFGHLKLRKVLNSKGPSENTVSSSWPVIGQFSSIGSLGNSADQWLCKEFLVSMSTVQNSSSLLGQSSASLKLIYPSVDDVRTSLEGYPAGASLPYSIHVARKQPYLRTFLHRWKCAVKGRTRASPHLKSYLRASPQMDKLAWFLITSANLSKAAWGCLEKSGSQLMIRSYELGVLFLPNSHNATLFKASSEVTTKVSKCNEELPFPVFYDLPPVKYSSSDHPWIWDIPQIAAPDSHGNKWCPP